MSAIVDGSETHEPIKVLFTLHEGMDTLDLAGPLEVLGNATHKPKDKSTKAFKCAFVANDQYTTTDQGAAFKAHFDYKEAHKRLKDFDVLVVPGGGSDAVLKAKSEPIALIKAFGELQKKDSSRERTLLSVCTGALFLAQAGVLAGMAATTHPDSYIKLEKTCQEASARDMSERTDVMEERYVVNNGRFDLGDDIDENPHVRPSLRRKSIARKGSNAWKESNNRRESNARRAAMKLGGLRVITAGGVTAGMDAALYLVSAMVSNESAEEVGRVMQYVWNKGVVVDSIDV